MSDDPMSSTAGTRYAYQDEPLTALRQMRRICLVIGGVIVFIGLIACLVVACTDGHDRAYTSGLTAIGTGCGFCVVAACAHVGLLALQQGATNYKRLSQRLETIMRVELQTAQAVEQIDELGTRRNGGRS